MPVRISFLQGFNQGVGGIINLQQQVYNTQAQVSSRQRILTPADDPVASARIIQVNQELSQLEQYISNADSAETRLSLAENQIQQVNNILVRIRELAIQADAPQMTQTDRQGIGAEIDARLDELVDLANTRDVNGEYIFAGFQGETQPFVQNADGSFNYLGDDGQRMIQVASSTQIPISDSGSSIFMNIAAPSNRIDTAAEVGNTSTATITSSVVSDQANLDSVFPEDYIIVFTDATTYEVYDRSDLLADGTLDTVLFTSGTFASGDTIDGDAGAALGWEIAITGTPAAGDRFYVNSTQQQSVFDTVYNLSQGLKNLDDSSAGRDALDVVIADTLTAIGNTEANMSLVIAEIGARQNTLDSVRDTHDGVTLVNQQLLSELRDLDYAEALSRLSLETFVLEAAQQSFAKIANLSLFNFLR
jgi:flagellar hook-associated protein 3 FlgL